MDLKYEEIKKSLGDYYEEYYRPIPGEKQVLSSYFDIASNNCTFHFCIIKTLKGQKTRGKDSTVTCDYKFEDNSSNLIKSKFEVKWPAISVKENYINEVQIKWPHCMGIAPIESIELLIDGKPKYPLDSHAIYALCQLFRKCSKKDFENDIGNTQDTQNWTDKLPSIITSPILPLFFEQSFFPFHFKNETTSIVIRFTLKLKIENLLMMRKMQNGVWRDIKPNFAYIKGVDVTTYLPDPELIIYTTKNDPTEIQTYHNCKNWPLKLHYHGIEPQDEENKTYGSKVEVIPKSTRPVLATIIMAENVNSTVKNGYFNYTSNTENSKIGYEPISTFEIKVAGSNKVVVSSVDLTRSSISQFFPKSPLYPGIFILPYTTRIRNYGIESGIRFESISSNSKIVCHLENTDPSLSKPQVTKESQQDEFIDSIPLSETNGHDNKSPQFKIHVRHITLDSLIIDKDVNGKYIYE